MIIDQLFENNNKKLDESLADEFMSMARAKGYNPRLRGTPDEERARTDAMLKQRAADRANAPAPAPVSDEERAKLQALLKDLEAQFDPNYQYIDAPSGGEWQKHHNIAQRIGAIKQKLSQGVAEGVGNIGSAIKSLYQKIYAAGDDEIEYFYNDSPIFAQYWEEYEGDLDSIIAEVDPNELQVILDELESYVQNANLAEGEQLDELSWKDIQRGANKFAKGANKFTKNVADTGAAVGNAAGALGGAIKQVGKTAIADPVAATYNATKSGLNKAANVAANTYGDVKTGAQKVGQAGATVGTDLGNAAKSIGRGAANVAGGTAGALGAVAGGATTGVGRAAAKGFNTGVKNVGGNAVNRLQTNIMKQIDLKKTELADLEQELAKVSTPAPAARSVGGAQKSMPFYGTNPDTGKAWTRDELTTTATAPAAAPAPAATQSPAGFNAANVMQMPGMGKKPTPAPAKTPNFAGPGGYSSASTSFKPTAPAAPAAKQTWTAPTTNGAYNTKTGAATLGGKPMVAMKDLPLAVQQKLGSAVKENINRMLSRVETKEDVQKIKKYIDQQFVKHGLVSESAFTARNSLIEQVTQIAAVQRRAHARKS